MYIYRNVKRGETASVRFVKCAKYMRMLNVYAVKYMGYSV